MPTSPLKRPSTGGGSGGRLRRLLASLRPPERKGALPVQTGFPTSIADIVVKHHGRFTRNPRRQRHRAAAATSPPGAVAEPPPPPVPQAQERRELSVPQAHDTAAAAAVVFSVRPSWVVAAGGGAVVVLTLLVLLLLLVVVWSKQLVAVATLASVALSWIESGRPVRRRPRRPETEEEAAESPRPSCSESDDSGSCSADADSGDESSAANENLKRKQSRRRSLRKLLAGKLRSCNCKAKNRGTDARHGGGEAREHDHDHLQQAAEEAGDLTEAPPAPPPPEAISGDDRCRRRRGGALPLPVLVPIILAGLVAGKLPALALAVFCAAFSSSVDRVAVPGNHDPR